MGTASRSLLAAALCLSLSGCSGVAYVAESSLGQWRLFNRARPLEEVLSSPHTPESVRKGIEMVRKAKAFAVRELGLKATSSYETFVQLEAPCVTWAVSAAHPLLLEEKKWKFPIVGEVPYLGFFRKERAEEEARKLAAASEPAPDTWVRCVPAFSSLGWFPDPLYSSMITGKDRQIVDLVVHESLHATVWVSGSVDFNEKLASFVGLEGSLLWTRLEHGSQGLEAARAEVAGAKAFAMFMQETVARYRTEVKDLAAKDAFYRGLAGRYEEFLRRHEASSGKIAAPRPKLASWNNAALLAYSNYFADYSVFERMLARCEGRLGRFVGWIAAEQEKGERSFREDPEKHLARLAAAGTCP